MNTTVWLIRFTRENGESVSAVHCHNPIADYRAIDPQATSTAYDVAAFAELIEADKAYDLANDNLSNPKAGNVSARMRAFIAAEKRRAAALARVGGAA